MIGECPALLPESARPTRGCSGSSTIKRTVPFWQDAAAAMYRAERPRRDGWNNSEVYRWPHLARVVVLSLIVSGLGDFLAFDLLDPSSPINTQVSACALVQSLQTTTICAASLQDDCCLGCAALILQRSIVFMPFVLVTSHGRTVPLQIVSTLTSPQRRPPKLKRPTASTV